jgi:hypothetical protein
MAWRRSPTSGSEDCEPPWKERPSEGRSPQEADLSAISAALRVPLYFRRWFSREPINDSFVDLVVQGILSGVRRDLPKPREYELRRRSPHRTCPHSAAQARNGQPRICEPFCPDRDIDH